MKGSTQSTKTFLALCTAPLLLAMAASAMSSETEIYPTPSPVAEQPVTTSDMEETPAPSEMGKTSAPTAYYMESTSQGGQEKTPTDPLYGDDEEDEEETPMENPDDGAGSSCTNYDEDVSVFLVFASWGRGLRCHLRAGGFDCSRAITRSLPSRFQRCCHLSLMLR